MNNSKVYLVNKPSGLTSKDFADIIKENNNLKKICYCGRLDPMARGKMLLLGDEMCKKMDDHQGYDKTYQFEICYGLQTDTDDPLGIIENYNFNFDYSDISNRIQLILQNHPYEFDQNFHKYSSILINGKPYWLHTKSNNMIKDKPKHLVNIKSIKIIDMFITKCSSFVENIIKTINKIDSKHSFRQKEIIKQWEKFESHKNISSMKLEIKVSSGFYVRQFIRDLSNQLKFPLMVFDINRTDISINKNI